MSPATSTRRTPRSTPRKTDSRLQVDDIDADDVITLYFSQSLGGKVNRRLVLPGRGEAPPEDRGGGGGEHSA